MINKAAGGSYECITVYDLKQTFSELTTFTGSKYSME